MDIVLTRPTVAHAKDIEKFRREILGANDKDAFAGCMRRVCLTLWKGENNEIDDREIAFASVEGIGCRKLI